MADLNMSNNSSADDDGEEAKAPLLEKDFYGSYCLKFRIKHAAVRTEEEIYKDFAAFGEILDIWGAGFVFEKDIETANKNYTNKCDSEVYVRFYNRSDAKEALEKLSEFYHELTPAISDVHPDNHGTYTIFFRNVMAISAKDLFHEFSKFGEIRSLTGALDVKMGTVYISYLSKESSIQAFLNKTESCFDNMRFTLPRCEKDYFGTYCVKFYNTKGSPNYASEKKVQEDFGLFGEVVDIRGPGLFNTPGNDVYVRYWEKSSAQMALSYLVGRYDCLCITPATDIHPDKFGMFTLTFINEQNVTEEQVYQAFQSHGHVVSMTGPFGSRTGRIFVNYEDKEAALRALQHMLTSKQFHIRLAKSCKPPKFPKSVTNHFSAATGWGRAETPRKRKARPHEEDRGERWWQREKRNDWSYRGTECVEGGSEKRARYGATRMKKGRKSMNSGNIDEEVGLSYSYRAPFQDEFGPRQ